MQANNDTCNAQNATGVCALSTECSCPWSTPFDYARPSWLHTIEYCILSKALYSSFNEEGKTNDQTEKANQLICILIGFLKNKLRACPVVPLIMSLLKGNPQLVIYIFTYLLTCAEFNLQIKRVGFKFVDLFKPCQSLSSDRYHISCETCYTNFQKLLENDTGSDQESHVTIRNRNRIEIRNRSVRSIDTSKTMFTSITIDQIIDLLSIHRKKMLL